MRIRTAYGTLLLPLIAILSVMTGITRGVRAQDCGALEGLRILDTNLLSATVVAASEDVPEYCRVLGYVRPTINFEIRLPTSSWNGKFYMEGCGGFCGRIEADSRPATNALERNYATSKMDAGHWGDWRDGTWAYHNRQAEVDWAHRAVHETARVTKEVIEAFYGRDPRWSYFSGCSTGGRMANMEAWRYPEDFDGIISVAPVLDQTRQAILHAWLGKVNVGPDGTNTITAKELKIIEEAVYSACDPLDGLKDGLISDPRSCEFDPATLLCQRDEDGECLTLNQVDVLTDMYGGPRDSTGRRLFSGLPFGSEPYWHSWITGRTPDVHDDVIPQLYVDFMRFLAFQEDPGERYTVADFDFDRDPERMEYMGRLYNADNPDLDAFRERGGKLIMWHGWADAAIPPARTIEYYDSVVHRVGSPNEVKGFLRLFMIPGTDHCGIGIGPGVRGTGLDDLTVLENWVEQDVVPSKLITTKTNPVGEVLWTRPVCPYPQRAVYHGQGDVNAATSFTCVDPHTN